MSKQDDFLNGLLQRGLVDARKMAVVASAKRLPNGKFGFCLLCLKENKLHVYDTDFQQNVGLLMYSIDLSKISEVKSSAFIFNRYLHFTYNGFKYRFADFGTAKAFLAAIDAERK